METVEDFQTFYQENVGLIYRYIYGKVGNRQEAEDLTSDEAAIACAYADFPNHFGVFLPLAGITTVRQIRESAFDIRATSRLNRLYIELLKDNPEWGTARRRHDMNHFMSRLIFCFFALTESLEPKNQRPFALRQANPIGALGSVPAPPLDTWPMPS